MININSCKSWFKTYVEECSSNEVMSKKYLDWNKCHIENVCVNTLNVCDSLSLTTYEKDIAEAIALFHDLASFKRPWNWEEKQLNDYSQNTIELLKKEKILDGCTKREYEIITKAIEFHNTHMLPVMDDSEILFYTKLIRDADKLDLWCQIANYCKDNNDHAFKKIGYNLPDISELSDIILENIFHNSVSIFSDAKSMNDIKLIQISWIFDLNFTQSFKRLKEFEYIESICLSLPQSKEIKSVLEIALEYIDHNAEMPLRNDFDSPWKEIIEKYFEQFMRFFYPDIANDIDWSKGYISQDKELMQITREAVIGGRIADKLIQVWKINGEETKVLAHVEIQGQKKKTFSDRLFIYNYRASELYKKPVVTLAILADDNEDWRPSFYKRETWGCSTEFHFNSVKLLDFKNKTDLLEKSSNPFAVVVQSHLKAMETKKDYQLRYHWKVELTKSLYKRGFTKQEVLDLYHFIDWLIGLPKKFEDNYHQTIIEYKEENKMRYVTTAERIGMEKGILGTAKEMLIDVLTENFGFVPEYVIKIINSIDKSLTLKELHRKAIKCHDIKSFEGNLAMAGITI